MSGKKRVPTGMNKNLLTQAIVARLSDSLELSEKAAQASHIGVTHESSKAENKRISFDRQRFSVQY